PILIPSHFLRGPAYKEARKPNGAAAEYRRAADLNPTNPQGVFHRGRAEALEGRTDQALATIAELERMSSERYVTPSFIGTIFIVLGNKDRAFEWLDRAADGRSYDIIYLNVDPLFDGVRADPRFPSLVAKAGLP